MSEATISAIRPRHKSFIFANIIIILAFSIAVYLIFPDNLSLFTRIISITLLVLSLDLITGYCGVATLGQAALFGAGAYAAGIASVRFGFTDPILLTIVGLIAGAIAGFFCGLIILRARGLAQLVVSIAVVHLFHEIANKASSWTGGSDGLSGITITPLFGIFSFDLWGVTAYFYAVGLLIIVILFVSFVVRSPFGMLCRGIKEDPVRIEAIGASVQLNELQMYIISGAIAGIGGALNAISTQVVGLDSLSFTMSAEALVMLVLGGTGTIYGALIGSVTFLWFADIVSSINPFYWLTIVGVLLVVVVLFAPQGLFGLFIKFKALLRRLLKGNLK